MVKNSPPKWTFHHSTSVCVKAAMARKWGSPNMHVKAVTKSLAGYLFNTGTCKLREKDENGMASYATHIKNKSSESQKKGRSSILLSEIIRKMEEKRTPNEKRANPHYDRKHQTERYYRINPQRRVGDAPAGCTDLLTGLQLLPQLLHNQVDQPGCGERPYGSITTTAPEKAAQPEATPRDKGGPLHWVRIRAGIMIPLLLGIQTLHLHIEKRTRREDKAGMRGIIEEDAPNGGGTVRKPGDSMQRRGNAGDR
ncbi:hypothetical protein Taro_031238 [Colocasia esculenta]|uniref:Uncharacterized protein n=1 Tax=Colocasia esculenta TaxID=4460 RepID=A0A843W5U0_COLES|nr:hypothetical protein [Colocasia esculenta]